MSEPNLKPHVIATGLIIAGSITTIALHASGEMDKAKQAATVTAVVAGTALIFSRNQ